MYPKFWMFCAGIGAIEQVVIEIIVGCHIGAVILGGGAELGVQRHRGQTQLAAVGVEQLDEGRFLPIGGVPGILRECDRGRTNPGKRA